MINHRFISHSSTTTPKIYIALHCNSIALHCNSMWNRLLSSTYQKAATSSAFSLLGYNQSQSQFRCQFQSQFRSISSTLTSTSSRRMIMPSLSSLWSSPIRTFVGNRNRRKASKANHGKRPNSHVARRAKRRRSIWY